MKMAKIFISHNHKDFLFLLLTLVAAIWTLANRSC
jgi:ribonuclease BN (tRNA processing enzyme)